MMFPNSFRGGVDISNRSPASGNLHVVVCRYRCIIDQVITQSRCAFGCLRRNRSCRPGTPAQRKERAFAYPMGVFSSSLPPSETAVSQLSAVWCMGGVFAVPVRMMWLLVFAKICCGCLPSGDCDFSCTQIGDNSGCLDARSLTSPRCGLGVGRSANAETCAPAVPPRMRGLSHSSKSRQKEARAGSYIKKQASNFAKYPLMGQPLKCGASP